METMTTTKAMKYRGGQPYGWWFESHDTSLGCSPWLHSTLSELNEKTRAMLRMIEEDADTFTERVEMYYEKRPQLVSFVEDFYRAQRSLVEQIAHLRQQHDHVFTRHCKTSPLPCSYKPCDDVSFPSKDPPESPLDDLDDVDDYLSDVCHEDEELGDQEEIGGLIEEENAIWSQRIVEKEKAIEELQQRMSESEKISYEIMRENERLRVENGEMNVIKKRYEAERDEMEMKLKAEIEDLKNQMTKEGEKKRETMKLMDEITRNEMSMKDEEKREVIRQLSLAIELLKSENVFLKKRLATKRWWFFNPHMLQLSGLFNC